MTVIHVKNLIATLVLFLLAGTSGSGQQYDRERPLVPVPRVTLNATPASISPGRSITFVAQLSSSYPNIRFRFVFGDGAQTSWQSTPVVTHVYQTAGTYKPFVDIGVTTGSGVKRLGGSVRRLVHVTHAPSGPVELIVNPATAQPGRALTLIARTGSANPNLRYRFSFGDGSAVGSWQTSPQVSHVYSTSGTFTASVDVAVVTNRGIQQQASSRRTVTVSAPVAQSPAGGKGGEKSRRVARVGIRAKKSSTLSQGKSGATNSSPHREQQAKSAPVSSVSPPIPSPSLSPHNTIQDTEGVGSAGDGGDWRRYLWLLIPLALLAFIVGKLFFARPAVVGHADPGTSTVVDSSGLVNSSQVVTPANASESERAVSSSDPLVKNVRRKDG